MDADRAQDDPHAAPEPAAHGKRCWRHAAVVLAMALATAACALVLKQKVGHDAEFYDPDGFGRMAFQVAAGKGLLDTQGRPSAFRGPVVPGVLAGAVLLGGRSYETLYVAQCILFALANGVLGLVCWRIFGQWRVTLLAMGMYAGFLPQYPWFLNIFPEPTFTLFIAAFMLAWIVSLAKSPRWSLIAGVLLALAALAKPTMYIFLPLVLIYELKQRGLNRRGYAAIAALLVGFSLLEVPWIVRNYVVLGQFIPMTSNEAQAQVMFLNTWWQEANWHDNPYHKPDRFPPAGEGFWELPPEQREARFREMAAKNFREHPFKVLMLIPKRTMIFLFQMRERGWLPTHKSIVLCGLLYPLAIAGYFFLSRERRRLYGPCLWLLAFSIVFHSLLVAEYRYSHPLQPYIFMLAASALVTIAQWLRLHLAGGHAWGATQAAGTSVA